MDDLLKKELIDMLKVYRNELSDRMSEGNDRTASHSYRQVCELIAKAEGK